jgi:hypothetical protein
MRRLVLTALVALTLLFTVCIGLIHAQPYDDTDLRTFLMPSGDCVMPCFMGIRPGITRIDDALNIVHTHPWVDSYTTHFSTNGVVLITWSWSGQQPDYIDSRVVGGLSTGGTNFVDRIDFSTRLSMGSFVLWKPPDGGGLRCTSLPRVTGLFIHYNEDLIAEVNISPIRCLRGRCPITFDRLWFSPTLVTIGNNYLPHIDYLSLLRSPGCDYAE